MLTRGRGGEWVGDERLRYRVVRCVICQARLGLGRQRRTRIALACIYTDKGGRWGLILSSSDTLLLCIQQVLQ